jgi:predicted ATPase
MWLSYGYAFHGWAVAEQDRAEEGIAEIVEGIEAFRRVGAGRFLAYFHLLLSEAQRRAGRHTEALAASEEGLRAAATHDDHWVTAELHRARGAALLRRCARAVEDAS